MKKLFLLFSVFCIRAFANCPPCYVDLEYLFWNISQVNMPYVVTVESIDSFSNFKEVRQNDHWASGFRLTFGSCLPCALDTHFSWTRFHPEFTDRMRNEILIGNQLLAPNTPFIVGGDGFGGPASSKWNLNFDTFDWDLGTWIYLRKPFSIYPFLGLKGGMINQTQQITYENFLDTNNDNRVDASITERNDFWGIGPHLGFKSAFQIARNLWLNGDISASLLFGNQRSYTQTNFVETGDVEFPPYSSKFLTHKWRGLPFLQVCVGINWKGTLCRCYPLILGLGYEGQIFWDVWRTQNSIIQQIYITDAGYSPLTMQGFTAKASICF